MCIRDRGYPLRNFCSGPELYKLGNTLFQNECHYSCVFKNTLHRPRLGIKYYMYIYSCGKCSLCLLDC